MSRLIDHDPQPMTEAKPLKLLVLGLSRTGTSSLCIALAKLGYKTFHMNEALNRPKHYMPRFMEALQARFAPECNIKPYTKQDFDKLLSKYDAVSDVPAILFAPDLLDAYPAARIILTTRPPQSWVKSMQSSIWRYHSWRSWDLLQYFNPLIYWWQKLDRMDWDCWINSSWRADQNMTGASVAEADQSRLSLMPRHPRSAYHGADFTNAALRKVDEWNEYVRNLVQSQGREAAMLELPLGSGWEPLCDFLGVDVPRDERGEKEEYPRVWSADEMNAIAWQLVGISVATAVGAVVVPVSLVVGAVYWYRR